MDERLVQAEALAAEADALCAADDFAHAEAPARKALLLREAALGKEHLDVAKSLGVLAIVHMNLGNAATALPLAQRSADIYEAAGDAKRKDFAATLDTVAQLHSVLGNLEDACSTATRALEEMTTAVGDGHPELASTMLTVAMLTVEIGETETAIELYERARAIFVAAKGWEVHEALSYRGEADAHRMEGDLQKARACCIRALEIATPKLGPEHRMVDELAITLEEIERAINPPAVLN
jgi:tetratricopeptide (TPR) repeat protein